MKKLLVCLQVWGGDVEEGEDLVKLLCDIAPPGGYLSADLAVVTRFDCQDMKYRVLERAREVFSSVWVRRSRRKETGYPGGCNGLWHDTMQWAFEEHRANRMDYAALLTTEADACPLVQDWDEALLSSWAREAAEGARVVGFWADSGLSSAGHINGNALFHPRLAEYDPKLIGCSAIIAWDLNHAETFKRLGWKAVPEIFSNWKLPTASPEYLEHLITRGVAWLHGVKDSSARDWARDNLCRK